MAGPFPVFHRNVTKHRQFDHKHIVNGWKYKTVVDQANGIANKKKAVSRIDRK